MIGSGVQSSGSSGSILIGFNGISSQILTTVSYSHISSKAALVGSGKLHSTEGVIGSIGSKATSKQTGSGRSGSGTVILALSGSGKVQMMGSSKDRTSEHLGVGMSSYWISARIGSG